MLKKFLFLLCIHNVFTSSNEEVDAGDSGLRKDSYFLYTSFHDRNRMSQVEKLIHTAKCKSEEKLHKLKSTKEPQQSFYTSNTLKVGKEKKFTENTDIGDETAKVYSKSVHDVFSTQYEFDVEQGSKEHSKPKVTFKRSFSFNLFSKKNELKPCHIKEYFKNNNIQILTNLCRHVNKNIINFNDRLIFLSLAKMFSHGLEDLRVISAGKDKYGIFMFDQEKINEMHGFLYKKLIPMKDSLKDWLQDENPDKMCKYDHILFKILTIYFNLIFDNKNDLKKSVKELLFIEKDWEKDECKKEVKKICNRISDELKDLKKICKK